MRKRMKLTPTKRGDYRHRSFVFPNKLFADLENLRKDYNPPISLNAYVRKILENYVKMAK